jgi:hypothetical protein
MKATVENLREFAGLIRWYAGDHSFFKSKEIVLNVCKIVQNEVLAGKIEAKTARGIKGALTNATKRVAHSYNMDCAIASGWRILDCDDYKVNEWTAFTKFYREKQ